MEGQATGRDKLDALGRFPSGLPGIPARGRAASLGG
jgi:hypothetical protein